MDELKFDEQVDITDKVCPMTFVEAKGEHGRAGRRRGAGDPDERRRTRAECSEKH